MSGGCGALVKTEIIYARAVRASEETKGHMRVAENAIRVNIDGTKDVAEFSPAGGYYLVHQDDLAGFVRAADRLGRSDAAGKLMTAEEYEAAVKSEK